MSTPYPKYMNSFCINCKDFMIMLKDSPTKGDCWKCKQGSHYKPETLHIQQKPEKEI